MRRRIEFDTALLWALIIAIILAVCLGLSGCAFRGPKLPALPPPGGADLSYLLLVTVGVAMLGIAASVVALVWLPTKRLAIAGLAGSGALLAIALTVKTIQPYLGWIVLAGLVAAAVAAIVAIRKLHLGTELAVRFGNDALRATTLSEIEAVKAANAALQDTAGVRGLIQKALAKAQAPAA